jgi:hypothetical protein
MRDLQDLRDVGPFNSLARLSACQLSLSKANCCQIGQSLQLPSARDSDDPVASAGTERFELRSTLSIGAAERLTAPPHADRDLRWINFFSAVPHLQLRGFLKVSWCALVTSLTTLVDYYLMRLSRPRYSSKGSEAANRR